ncbi:hypothetical protein [Halorussus halophilus]|uniref:hypothetical protein n=1 Tax=Halorussus halophilus TaxID=2650975 RepID=UPI0013011ACE|nr:hypothetical protein [Halorussus halophilus]
MRNQADAIVDELDDDLGDDLHGVFYGDFRNRNYTVAHLHDEVQDEFEPSEIMDLVSAVVNEQLEIHDHDDLTHMLGDVRVTVRAFENSAHILVWDSREETGLMVGTSHDAATIGTTLAAVESTVEA